MVLLAHLPLCRSVYVRLMVDYCSSSSRNSVPFWSSSCRLGRDALNSLILIGSGVSPCILTFPMQGTLEGIFGTEPSVRLLSYDLMGIWMHYPMVSLQTRECLHEGFCRDVFLILFLTKTLHPGPTTVSKTLTMLRTG